MTATALVLFGHGRYADPWHPFAETSAAIAQLLADQGFTVETSGDVDARLAALADSPHPGLLVLDIGDPALNFPDDPAPAAEQAARRGLLSFVTAGGALLAFHVSATSLRGIPEWEEILGGVWVRGQSFHPEYGPARIHVRSTGHPITAGLGDFELPDERYTDLRLAPTITVLATHTHEGAEHPVLWTNRSGDSRIVYDALGHDAEAFRSPEHREIIRNAVAWLTG